MVSADIQMGATICRYHLFCPGSLPLGYREFAERAGNPAISEARLRTAKQLEAEADRADANTVFAPRDADEN